MTPDDAVAPAPTRRSRATSVSSTDGDAVESAPTPVGHLRRRSGDGAGVGRGGLDDGHPRSLGRRLDGGSRRRRHQRCVRPGDHHASPDPSGGVAPRRDGLGGRGRDRAHRSRRAESGRRGIPVSARGSGASEQPAAPLAVPSRGARSDRDHRAAHRRVLGHDPAVAAARDPADGRRRSGRPDRRRPRHAHLARRGQRVGVGGRHHAGRRLCGGRGADGQHHEGRHRPGRARRDATGPRRAGAGVPLHGARQRRVLGLPVEQRIRPRCPRGRHAHRSTSSWREC